MIVVDASVLTNAIADGGHDGRRARDELRTAGDLAAPDVVDVETIAALRKACLRGDISDRRFATCIADLQSLGVVRYPTLPFMRRAYELRHNITPYDAVYVALAETMDCELLTADRKLAAVGGLRCAVRVLH